MAIGTEKRAALLLADAEARARGVNLDGSPRRETIGTNPTYPALADLRVHVYLNGAPRGTTPDGQPWSSFSVDCSDDGLYLGQYRLGDLR